MKRTLLLLLFLPAFQSSAQRLENIRAEVIGDGEKVVITYDINGASEGQKFRINVFGSHNNFASPLALVAGDAGIDKEVLPGPNKRIEWSSKSELREFAGDITFELRADIIAAPQPQQEKASPLVIMKPAGGTFKKGKTAELSWRGGAPGERVQLELLKGGAVVNQIGNAQNSQSFYWAIPKDISKGGDYQVRLTAGSQTATSGNFAIKSKTPILLIVAPVVVIGAVVAIIALKPEKKGNELPVPPEPVE